MNVALKALRSEEHVSVSSLGTYIRCPRQYEHRYVLRTPTEFRSSALAFGSAVHIALAGYYSKLRDNEQGLGLDELQTLFRDAWKESLKGEVPVLFSDKETEDSLTDTGTAIMGCFLENAPKPYAVTEVEMPFSIEMVDQKTGDLLPRLVGVFDAVVQDENGFYRILEHKTAIKRWSQDKLSFDPQITAYHVAAPLMGLGEAHVTVQLLLKTKKAAFEVYSPTRTEADQRDFMSMASGVLKAVRAGAFYPVRDWFCRTCEYASRCVAG